MQGSYRLIPVMLLALLVFSGTAIGQNFSDDIAAEAEVKAFSSVDNASLAVYAGQNALQSGRYDEAAGYFTEALEADPSWMAAWYLKAYSLEKLNRTDEALDAIDQALLLDPKDRDSNTLKAELLESRGRTEEAALYREVAAASQVSLQSTTPVTALPTTKAPLSPILGLSAVLITLSLLCTRGTQR